jgi:hypothetical protein
MNHCASPAFLAFLALLIAACGAPARGDVATDALGEDTAPSAAIELPAALDGDAAPRPDCDYISVDERVARCAGAYRWFSYFTSSSSGGPACASFYGLDPSGTRYASFEKAVAGQGCDTTCLWHASTAVDGLRCGHRWGYETLKAENQSCPTLFRMPEGYYTSLAEYEAAHPCP